MNHTAATSDGFAVVEWTGPVPRIGETIRTYGSVTDMRGKWRVVDVEWSMCTEMDAEANAVVTVEPADGAAVEWLEERRASRSEKP